MYPIVYWFVVNYSLDYDQGISAIIDEGSDFDEEESEMVHEMMKLIPGVIKQLQQSGHFDEGNIFMRMVKDCKFPTDNISFRLFLDVISCLN